LEKYDGMMAERIVENKLRIGKCMVSTNVNGPGRRFVIWFQGCRFHCPGCFNPELWDEDGGKLADVEEIAAQINLTTGIEGVTFTGGEPLLQAKSLLPLAKWIQSKGLSIVCYSGYLHQEIIDGEVPCARELLNWLDILIDGLYLEDERTALPWRGSRNQKVYFLTDRYKSLEPMASKEGIRQAELQVGKDGLTVTGIFDIQLWNSLKKKISETQQKT
jgi:anaerobic ribonucleoside-triphosphate reductase activating protein